MWQILITGSYAGLHLPQWGLAWMTAIAIAAICRLAGHSPSAALFSSALYLSLPGVVLQMSTPLNDLVTAFGAVTFAYFMIAGTLESSQNDRTYSMRNCGYAGIAFGVFIGTKATALLILPSLGVISITLLLRRFRHGACRIAKLAAACVLGFLAFGAYNYLLNFAEFGSPIASAAAVEFQASRVVGAAEGASSPLSNMVRYIYQAMDWMIIQPIPGIDTLYAVNNTLYRSLDNFLDLKLESVPAFTLDGFGMRRVLVGEIGFGPIGYLMIIVSPFALVAMLLRIHQTKGAAISAVLLVLAIGWFVSFSSLLPWWDSRIRYAALFFALIVPALAPFAYSHSRLASIWLVPVMALALWCAFQTSSASRAFEKDDRRLASWQIEILRSSLPQDAHIAVVGSVEFHHLLRQFERYRFSPVPRAQAISGLMATTVDAALVYDPNDTLFMHRLPIEQDQSLLVKNPLEIVRANLDWLGVSVGVEDGVQSLKILHSGLIRRWGPDLVQIFIPTVGPILLSDDLVMEISAGVPPPDADGLALDCNGTEVALETRRAILSSHDVGIAFSMERPYQLCKLHITDLEFGRTIRSDEIEIQIRPYVEGL